MSKPPMREPTFLIPTALVEGPQHGYAILEEVRRISEGRVDPADLSLTQWLALVLTPLLVLAVAVAAVNRWERNPGLPALGSATDRWSRP